MISEKIQEALNKHLNFELYSSYLYLSMSAYFESTNLRGFAHWMRVQAQEELGHAMKFYSFIHERGGRVTLRSVDSPPSQWESPLSAFQDAYAHEKHITAQIYQLVDLATDVRDRATEVFLQWFVTEQVEEEASASEIVEKLKLIGDARGGLFMLDRELAGRTSGPS